jgi:hypothetical protein
MKRMPVPLVCAVTDAQAACGQRNGVSMRVGMSHVTASRASSCQVAADGCWAQAVLYTGRPLLRLEIVVTRQ